jgi:hypothetical protein
MLFNLKKDDDEKIVFFISNSGIANNCPAIVNGAGNCCCEQVVFC